MSRGFTTSTGKTLLKQDLLTKRKKARNAHINGVYQQIEKIILAINPSFSRSTIKKFVETYQDTLATNSVVNSTSISLKNKIYDTGKIWLQHYGLELPESWKKTKVMQIKKGGKESQNTKKIKIKTKPLNKKQIKILHKELDKSLSEIRSQDKQKKSTEIKAVETSKLRLKK